MLTDIRAEATVQGRRLSSWLLVAIACALTVTFGYLIPYAAYAGVASEGPTTDRELVAMLPSEFLSGPLGPLVVFAGALGLTYGALATGAEYGFGTWKSILTQQPRRMQVYGAKLVTLAGAAFVMLLGLFFVSSASSFSVAVVEDQPAHWPPFDDIVIAFSAGWLILIMWTFAGSALALAFRSVALPIGLGLVWMLAVQNLLSTLAAPQLEWYADVEKLLPGPNAGSVVAALGASMQTPGVTDIVSAGHGLAVITCYTVSFVTIGGWLFYYRDID